jgi:hypothetical protein
MTGWAAAYGSRMAIPQRRCSVSKVAKGTASAASAAPRDQGIRSSTPVVRTNGPTQHAGAALVGSPRR